MVSNKLLLAGIVAAVAIFSVAVVPTAQMAFADKNGAENPNDNNSYAKSANPEVPAGAHPQPNPMKAKA